MKTGAKVALAGSICALSFMIMLLTVVPTLEIALPALSGILLVILVLELGLRWGFTGYFAVALLSLLLAPSVESRMLFICFFGYYPVLKAVIERIPARILCWLAKILLFNAAMVAGYFVLMQLTTAVDLQEFTVAGKFLPGVILALGNVVFVVYDIAVTRLIGTYLHNWQPRVHKMFHF